MALPCKQMQLNFLNVLNNHLDLINSQSKALSARALHWYTEVDGSFSQGTFNCSFLCLDCMLCSNIAELPLGAIEFVFAVSATISPDLTNNWPFTSKVIFNEDFPFPILVHRVEFSHLLVVSFFSYTASDNFIKILIF